MGIQVVGRHGHRADVDTRENVSIRSVRKRVIDRTAIMQVPDEDGYIVVGSRAGVSPSTRPE